MKNAAFFKLLVRGGTSLGFRGFLALTIVTLLVANLIHAEHYLLTSTGKYNLKLCYCTSCRAIEEAH